MINLCLLVISTLKNQNHVYHNSFMNKMPRTLSRCFKNALNPRYIDPFRTNSPLSFQNEIAVSNGLSDFHKMVITVMKMSVKKHSPIERHYRDYKYFERSKFRNNLNKKLSEDIFNYESFEITFIEVLNKHAPFRKKFHRANHAPYIAKTLSKANMHRSQK